MTRDAASSPEAKASQLRLGTRVQNVDPFGNKMMDVLVTPELTGSIGTKYPTASISNTDLLLYYTNLSGSSFVQFDAGQLAGSQPVSVFLVSDDHPYPFDSYKGYWQVLGIRLLSGSSLPDIQITDRTASINGFDISIRQGASRYQEGSLIQNSRPVVWTVSRSKSDQFAVILLGLLMIIGAVSSVLVTASIVRAKRPPSLAALAWLAAFLFALFEVRRALPGSPPSGNPFDRFIFFPVLLTISVSTQLTLRAWLRRDDWDLENKLHAVYGALRSERSDEA